MNTLNRTDSRKEYLDWIRNANPDFFSVADRDKDLSRYLYLANANGLGDAATAPTQTEESLWSKAINSIQSLVPTYLQYKMGNDIYKLNLARAQQGLPPIDTSAISPQLQIGVSSDTRNSIMFLGLAAIAALFFVFRKRK